MRMPFRSKLLYPCTPAFTVYVAGSTAGNENSPAPLLTVSRLTLVASLRRVTVTPGMIPWASFTVPRKPPWNDWASTMAGVVTRTTAASAAEERSVRIIYPPEA
jgi:hypothetical protein